MAGIWTRPEKRARALRVEIDQGADPVEEKKQAKARALAAVQPRDASSSADDPATLKTVEYCGNLQIAFVTRPVSTAGSDGVAAGPATEALA